MKAKIITIISIGLSLCIYVPANAQQAAKTITDGYHTITYTSLLDARKKLIEYKAQLKQEKYDEGDYGLSRLHMSPFPMDMLTDLLRKEPLANHFLFGFDEIREISSPDLKIKCYMLKDATWTAAGDFEGTIVITNGKNHKVIPIYDGPDYVLDIESIQHIDSFTTIDGKTVYAVVQQDGSTDLFTLDGTRLLPIKLTVDVDRINNFQGLN